MIKKVKKQELKIEQIRKRKKEKKNDRKLKNDEFIRKEKDVDVEEKLFG